MAAKYVRHISGEGKKWEVALEGVLSWACPTPPRSDGPYFFLPKSEYVLCEPPEQWVDVTSEMEKSTSSSLESWDHHGNPTVIHIHDSDYRLRKVQFSVMPFGQGYWAFIVEKKEP